MKILVINLAYIGDVILCGPVIRALHNKYEFAQIDFLAAPPAADIAKLLPGVRTVLCYDKKGKDKNVWRALRVLAKIRAERYDMAVCCNFAIRGAVLSWLAGIPRRIGYDARHAGWFLTDKVSENRPTEWHEAKKQLMVLRPLGIGASDNLLRLKTTPTDRNSLAGKVVVNDNEYVVVCPYGSYERKAWSDDKYLLLLQQLRANGWKVLLIGSKAELGKLNDLAERSLTDVKVLAGVLNLGELAALIERARLVISVDTGPMHIADALMTPLVALFGPTEPDFWGPRSPDSTVLYRRNYCQPCYNRRECVVLPCVKSMEYGIVWQTVIAKLKDK